MSNTFHLPLKGIVPPMVTPLTFDSKLDSKGLNSILEHLIRGGVHGIFILGTTGESASLSVDFKNILIEESLRIVDGRVPVLVGITDSSTETSRHLANEANKYGANALVSAPPFYFNLSQCELIDYYNSLADKLPLPMFLYNMPSHTQISFEVDTVLKLSKHPKIIGLKDSSGNAPYFKKLLYSVRKDSSFILFTGPEEILAESVLMGGDGGVPGGANLFPELYVELYDAAIKKDFSRIIPLHNLIMEISTNLYSIDSNQSSYLKGLKAALSCLNICAANLVSPLTTFKNSERDLIAKRLEIIQHNLSEII
ncbi:dihydrodipicolinate synthase family protein [Flavobacterium weaverense]|uniref:4-hydroxy-tetrahydrodipicolinate synthase n=1 Tax=Flavobacterium weaverense TaxID=271156 RepID=A0A3M0A286_9FLAO|nr:dihydrodipicolinate synthase family protein [Flavobacterium weaverense]RMA73122.1 4-hydroxy-tetrahydrodipicolinate synthase [Flavobacterium weaverense]